MDIGQRRLALLILSVTICGNRTGAVVFQFCLLGNIINKGESIQLCLLSVSRSNIVNTVLILYLQVRLPKCKCQRCSLCAAERVHKKILSSWREGFHNCPPGLSGPEIPCHDTPCWRSMELNVFVDPPPDKLVFFYLAMTAWMACRSKRDIRTFSR